MRSIVGVYFRLRSDATVWGHFNQRHRQMTLGQAIGVIMHAPDPMGFQLVVPASIDARAIHTIRRVPQVVGWRHFPDSHIRGPWKCLCDLCLQSQKGQIKSRRLRRALLEANSPDELNVERDPKQLT